MHFDYFFLFPDLRLWLTDYNRAQFKPEMALLIVIADSSDHGSLRDQKLFPVFSASDLFHEVNQSVLISPTPKLTIHHHLPCSSCG